MTERTNVDVKARLGVPFSNLKPGEKAPVAIPDYCPRAFYVLHKESFPRKQVIQIVHNKWFDRIIITLIVANCGFLAADDPLDTDPNSALQQVMAMAELIFLVLFTIEAVLKIITQGFFVGKNTYLRNAWNWLDFLVVIIGYIGLAGLGGNLSGLRTFRVLRPLKTMTTVPGMRVIVVSMMSSIPSLSGVGLLSGFFFFVFGIIGVQLWGGVLKSRCFYNTTNVFANETVWLVADGEFCAFQCPGGKSTGKCTQPMDGSSCGTRWNGTEFQVGECMQYENPNFGAGSFDNIGDGIITVFTSVTLEGWVDVMYALYHSFGANWLVSTYFVLLVVFGSFFVMNLAMAVIWDEYEAADTKNKERMEAAEKAEKAEQDEKDEKEKKERQDSGLPEPTVTVPVASDGVGAEGEGEDGGKRVVPPWSDNPIVKACNKLVNQPLFGHFITLMIILNTISLGLEFYSMPDELKLVLKYFNYIFFTVFLLEMLLKWVGLGLREYAKDAFNVFDCVIVIISVVEFVIEMIALSSGGASKKSGLSALRSFRLLRVFKLARSWVELQKLLVTIMQSVIDVTNAAILLIVVMFIFTLLGMQLFGGRMKYEYYGETPADKPKAHFDSFWWAFVAVFQVLTGENWNEIIFNTQHALKQDAEVANGGHYAMAIVYFVLLNVVGNFMILNLFLAILLSNFEGGDEEDEEEAETPEDKYKKTPQIDSAKVAPLPSGGPDAGAGAGSDATGQVDVMAREGSTNFFNAKEASFCFIKPDNPLRVAIFRLCDHQMFDNVIMFLIFVSTVMLCIDVPANGYCKTDELAKLYQVDSCADFMGVMVTLDWIISILFGFEMVLKMIALGFAFHKGAYLRDGWNWLDFVIVIISFLSLAMAGDPGLKALRSLRALRALKPLRVVRKYPGLRLVVNAIFKSLPAIFNVTLVSMLFYAIFAILGVQMWMGGMKHCNDETIAEKADCVGSFNLTWDQCGWQPYPRLVEECQKDTWTVDSHPKFDIKGNVSARLFPRQWENVSPWNFDHIGNAMLTLFEVSSGEMWPDIMYDAVNVQGMDTPMYEYTADWPAKANPYFPAIYFIMAIVVIDFLMTNVFVGVVIDNYNEIKDEETGAALITNTQKQWLDMMRLLLAKGPELMMEAPISTAEDPSWKQSLAKLRKPFFYLVESKKFEMTIMTLIVANTFCLALRITPQEAVQDGLLATINLVFGIIFTIEMACKIIGLGMKQYLSTVWNRFDCFLVCASWVGMIFDVGQFATLLRIVRVARIFRLVRTSRSLLELFKTLVFALPAISNVGAVTILAFLIFSVLGMNLFAYVKPQELLNEDANFNSFDVAFMTLFRSSTGESFNGIMHDLMIEEPYCLKERLDITGCGVECDANCGAGSIIPPVFFVFFFVLLNFILLNLIVAIVLDTFGDTVRLNDNAVTEGHMESFQDAWAFYDHNANKWIDVKHLPELITKIEAPLGLQNKKDENGIVINDQSVLMTEAREWEQMLNIKVAKHDETLADNPEDVGPDGFCYEISFQETLQALALRAGKEFKFDFEQVPDKVKAQMTKEMDRKAAAQKSKAMKRKSVETIDLSSCLSHAEGKSSEGTAPPVAPAIENKPPEERN